MSTAGVIKAPRRDWLLPLGGTACLLALTLILYRDTAASMIGIWWRSDTFNHAFLVPPIVAWLIWRRRHDLAHARPQSSSGALILVAAMAALWTMGELVAVNAATQLAFTGLLVLTVPVVLGWDVSRRLLFPLTFLFFAVPIGEFLVPAMMGWTADFTVLALQLSGIPVYREGHRFVIPSGSWSVVEACSGVRYLMAALTVGTLFGYLNYSSAKKRWIFVGVSLAVPLLANWLRAYLIVMLGHLSDNRLAAGADHLVYGWLFFGVVIAVMFAIGTRWADPQAPARSAALPQPVNAPGYGMRPAVVALAAVLTVLPHALLVWVTARETQVSVNVDLPSDVAGWAVTQGAPLFKPGFQNPSFEVGREYSRDGEAVGLYVAYYRQQSYSRKLVSSENQLVRSNSDAWNKVAADTVLGMLEAQRVAWRASTYRGPARAATTESTHLRAWQLYWVNGYWLRGDIETKVIGALLRMLGHGTDGAAVVVYAIGQDPSRLDEQLRRFVEDAGPALADQLRLAYDQR